jgi:uncharacterized protein YdeI (YjbR/CyaY-like superfamily)
MQQLTFNTRDQFRRWLEANHDKEEGIWLVYYKKKTGIPGILYDEAVEEALCFGWIDSKVQTIDDMRYKQVFTPRRSRSVWSELNKKRVQMLADAGLMMPSGLKAVEKGKKSGMWDKSYGGMKVARMPKDLQDALMENPQAMEHFKQFAKSYRYTYIRWVDGAKRPETRDKRIGIVVENSLKQIKPGMM